LFSCGTDECVRVWDTRSGQQTQQLKGLSELNSADVNSAGTLLAAGSEAGLVLFWDIRTLAPVTKYEDSHTDAVTQASCTALSGIPKLTRIDILSNQVAFHPRLPGKLYSGALDGLINIFDVTMPTEDDALVGGMCSSCRLCGYYTGVDYDISFECGRRRAQDGLFRSEFRVYVVFLANGNHRYVQWRHCM
jgi:hypothetical protein